MHSGARTSIIEISVLEQAAHWFAVLRAEQVSAAEQAGWRAWLEADSAHRLAWSKVEEIERRFHQVPSEPARIALTSAGASRRDALKTLAVLGVGAPALWMGWRLASPAVRADYRTGTGEIREIRLPEGSRVWLNTASALDLRFNQQERRLILRAGEMMIETAPDSASPPRPLLVESTAGTLRPLGTRFSLRDRGEHVVLRVFDGTVAVRTAMNSAQEALVQAGQTLNFSATGSDQPLPLTAEGEAWTRGILLANDMRLADFLAELGRYRHGYLGYAPAVAELRLLGSYPLNDTDRILAAIEAALPVKVRRVTPWWVRVDAR